MKDETKVLTLSSITKGLHFTLHLTTLRHSLLHYDALHEVTLCYTALHYPTSTLRYATLHILRKVINLAALSRVDYC